MKRSDDVLDVLAASDPAGGNSTDAAGPARLAAIRAMVDAATTSEPISATPGTRSVWPRVLVVVGVAAAVLAALPILIPALLPDGARGALAGLAIADDGQLNCGQGQAAAIPPRDADLRLLPATLPSGWTLTRIFARDETQRGYCVPPSLTVADPAKAWRRLSIYGPFPAISLDELGAGTPVTVLGRPAMRFDDESALPVELHRWVWKDEAGRTWMAEALGYGLPRAETVLTSIRIEADQARWEPTDATGSLSVLHQRTGPPYGADSHTLGWYVDLDGPDGPVSLQISRSYRDEPAPLLAAVNPGRLGVVTQLNGHPLILADDGESGSPTFLAYQVAPGAILIAEIHGQPSADLLAILGSLTNVPADDPRLATYALDEDYG